MKNSRLITVILCLGIVCSSFSMRKQFQETKRRVVTSRNNFSRYANDNRSRQFNRRPFNNQGVSYRPSLRDAVFQGDLEEIKNNWRDVFDKNGGGDLICLALVCNKSKRDYDRTAVISTLVDVVEKYYPKEKLYEFVHFKTPKKDCPVFLLAISKGCREIVEKLIKAGVDITIAKKSDGETSLQAAVFLRNDEERYYILDLLLKEIKKKKKYSNKKKNKYLNKLGKTRSGDIDTVLNIAISNEDEKAVEKLLKAGVDITRSSDIGNTSLHKTLFIKNKEIRYNILGLLLEKLKKKRYANKRDQYLNKVNKTQRDADTVFNIAVSKGDEYIVTELIKGEVDITVAAESGQTCLHKVLFIEDEGIRRSIFDLLLNELAQEKYDKVRKDFLNMVCKTQRDEDTVLSVAVSNGDEYAVRKLLDAGVDATIENNNDENSLYKAVASGNVEIVKLIAVRFQDVNKVSKETRRTALQIVVRLLKGSPKKRNKQDAKRLSIEYILQVIEILLCKNATLLGLDYYGKNLLYWLFFGDVYGQKLYTRKESVMLLDALIKYATIDNKLFEALDEPCEVGGKENRKTPLDILCEVCKEPFANRKELLKKIFVTKGRRTRKTLYQLSKEIKNNGKLRRKMQEKFKILRKIYDRI